MKELQVQPVVGEPSLDIAYKTIQEGKQALVFVNSKRSAEASAEKLGKKLPIQNQLKDISEDILKAVSSPTKQCRRLAYCVERGTAFHHSGLTSKQRRIVEEAFILGDLKVIAATPTLAAGVNVPAYRCIIRDLKRFSGAGMTDIPVLEYHQMAGRAGRPDFHDDHGEAIVLAKSESDAERVTEQYLYGDPESIYSKVSAMPVLRTYCLSLVATEFVKTRDELIQFFSETFFAHQYGDMKGITQKIDDTIQQLTEWGFLKGEKSDDFQSAKDLIADELVATQLGRRVSQLYLDPLSAHQLIKGLMRLEKAPFFAYVHLCCSTQEARPLLRIKVTDYEDLEPFVREQDLLVAEPSIYDHEYEQFLGAIKTAKLLTDWAEELDEQSLLDAYGARPGELRARINIADWLLYAAAELARLLKRHQHISQLQKARTRLKYGVKEQLLPLLRYKGIGRVRARQLYKNGITDTKAIKEVDAHTLAQLIGPGITKDLKKQVGQDVEAPQISTKKRVGQLSLDHQKFN